MQFGSMSERPTKRKIEKLQRGLDEVKRTQGKQRTMLNHLATRVDRMDRSTTLVVEYSTAVERTYKTAEETKDFSKLARDSAEALLREVAPE